MVVLYLSYSWVQRLLILNTLKEIIQSSANKSSALYYMDLHTFYSITPPWILGMRVVLSRPVFPWNSAPRMAYRDRKLVVRNALTPMAEKGLPRFPEFLGRLIVKLPPLRCFWDQNTTFTRLLFVIWTNIYEMAAKSLVSSHRLQCFTVIPTSDRRDGCTMKIRQTRLRGIGYF